MPTASPGRLQPRAACMTEWVVQTRRPRSPKVRWDTKRRIFRQTGESQCAVRTCPRRSGLNQMTTTMAIATAAATTASASP